MLYGVAPAADDSPILAALKTDLWTNPYGPMPFTSNTGYSPTISPYISGYELDARLVGQLAPLRGQVAPTRRLCLCCVRHRCQ